MEKFWAVMKAELGCLAGIVGGLLIIAGGLLMGFCIMYSNLPANQGVGGDWSTTVAEVFVAVILGAALCYLSWRLFWNSK